MPDSFLSFAQVLKFLIKIVTPYETYSSKCNTVFFTQLKKAAQSTWKRRWGLTNGVGQWERRKKKSKTMESMASFVWPPPLNSD